MNIRLYVISFSLFMMILLLSLFGCKKEESIGFQVSSGDGEITVFLNSIKNTSTNEKHEIKG